MSDESPEEVLEDATEEELREELEELLTAIEDDLEEWGNDILGVGVNRPQEITIAAEADSTPARDKIVRDSILIYHSAIAEHGDEAIEKVLIDIYPPDGGRFVRFPVPRELIPSSPEPESEEWDEMIDEVADRMEVYE